MVVDAARHFLDSPEVARMLQMLEDGSTRNTSLRDSECPGMWLDNCEDATRRLVGTKRDKFAHAVLQPRRTIRL